LQAVENTYAFALLFQKSEYCCVVHLFCLISLGRIIIWVGSNDINKNESSTGLKQNFTLQNQHTNIIIIPALYRHDLVKSSCIINEIQSFNRKLSKMTKTMLDVEMLDVTLDRKDFT
jgi:hypothetical protein